MWNNIKRKSASELVMYFSGIIVFITGALANIGWILDIRVLSSVLPGYIPMAQTSATIFMILGVMMILNLFENKNPIIRPITVTVVILITFSGFLHVFSHIINRELTLDQFLIGNKGMIGNFPLNKMSHYGGLLFFLTGLAILVRLLGKEKPFNIRLVGNIGLFVAFAGFVASLGYTFGTPLLYSGSIIPLAFSSAICFVFVGSALVITAGQNNYIVRKLSGPSASARILRTFLPFLILVNLIGDTMERYISKHFEINEALISAFATLISIIIAISITLYLTKRIFKSSDKAEAERLIAVDALKESLELRSTLLKTIPFGMDIIDKNGTILFMNELMTNNLGESALGKKCWEAYRDDKTQCLECPLFLDIKIGETHSTESHNVLGGKIFEIIHTGLIFDGKEALLEIFHDITDRKQSELKLKEYASELVEANNTKNKLFSIIAHDLRSPFNSILGLTNLLNDKFVFYSEDDKKSIVVKLKESAENAFNLLENLLAWSLSQRNGIKVKTEILDLSEIASLQLEVFETFSNSKNIQIDNQIAIGTYADADRNMITTVMRNLLNNALKFTPTGGNIVISAFELNNLIEVSFTDNGVGISIDVLKELFKSNDSHTTKGTANENGTGLGLMVCKEFVEINGGAIWADSVVGKGSRFSFTLPAKK